MIHLAYQYSGALFNNNAHLKFDTSYTTLPIISNYCYDIVSDTVLYQDQKAMLKQYM